MTVTAVQDCFRSQFQSAVIVDIVRSCAEDYDVPICFVALHAQEELTIEAKIGLDIDAVSYGMCFHCTGRNLPVIIEDTGKCNRVKSDPLVIGPPFARFFAAKPLMLDSKCIGTLCILDVKPRALSLNGCERLSSAAEEIMSSFLGLHSKDGTSLVFRLAMPAQPRSYSKTPTDDLRTMAEQLRTFTAGSHLSFNSACSEMMPKDQQRTLTAGSDLSWISANSQAMQMRTLTAGSNLSFSPSEWETSLKGGKLNEDKSWPTEPDELARKYVSF
eukprot:TRINITY_DN29333_c0_g1_i1.p1 TRINITY_DN29333_c0_g1~~TRINITY_DN29333_c0_g1_i1.p1  ORF type:complete len:273 (+),score=15.41 TRINITY_DN29333_c0_g1_i1:377-1195(+)